MLCFSDLLTPNGGIPYSTLKRAPRSPAGSLEAGQVLGTQFPRPLSEPGAFAPIPRRAAKQGVFTLATLSRTGCEIAKWAGDFERLIHAASGQIVLHVFG